MKRKLLISQKAFNFALLFGLLCSAFISFAGFNSTCNELRENVLRLHIVANSNSKADQELKLQIRDAILKISGESFAGTSSTEEATVTAAANLKEYEETANRIIEEKGFGYKAEAKIGKAYFETREYDDFTLPAGEYNSLIITLGSGEGKNWWCVIFPEVCLPLGERGTLEETLSDEACSVARQKSRYVMQFWVVEKYEDIKNLIKR